MLERIWIHIQTYTIIALVNSPGLFMLWNGFQPTDIIHHGPQSTAVQEAPIEIYSIYIEPEDTEEIEQPKVIEQSPLEEQKPVKKPIKTQKEKIVQDQLQPKPEPKESTVPNIKISKHVPIPKISIKNQKRTRTKKSRRSSTKCASVPNRRIQQVSKNQYAVNKKALHRYLGNLDNIRGLAKAYWYSGKRGEGILLRSIPCKSPLRNMGLLPGDIVVSINGKKLENNLALVGHYFDLRSQKNTDIILKRHNRPITLQYEIVKKLKKG